MVVLHNFSKIFFLSWSISLNSRCPKFQMVWWWYNGTHGTWELSISILLSFLHPFCIKEATFHDFHNNETSQGFHTKKNAFDLIWRRRRRKKNRGKLVFGLKVKLASETEKRFNETFYSSHYSIQTASLSLCSTIFNLRKRVSPLLLDTIMRKNMTSVKFPIEFAQYGVQ